MIYIFSSIIFVLAPTTSNTDYRSSKTSYDV